MFEAIARGEIKALWVIGTNPAVSLPDADAARAALKKLELFVVSENVRSNDTVDAGPHVLLPALAWGEKSGTVTNSERRISRQRAFRAAPGEARPDWWILSEVARRIGWEAAFPYRRPADIFREHAALSGFENCGNSRRIFDIGALCELSDAEYDQLPPLPWPLTFGKPWPGTERLFGDGEKFPTDDGRAHFVPTPYRPAAVAADDSWPLLLNTGRVRDQWHTMTRTGLAPRLMAHRREPLLDVHPDDAARLGVVEGG